MYKRSLGLNIIVGPGHGEALIHCLSSFPAKKYCDQIVIGITCDDPAVIKAGEIVAEKGGTVINVPWSDPDFPYGNFGRARQAVLDATTTDYVFWLDADDDLSKIEKCTWEDLREKLDSRPWFDVGYATYILNEDNGKSHGQILRERFWRRASGLRWRHACHENLDHDQSINTYSTMRGFRVAHAPRKSVKDSVVRNLKILQHEFQKPGMSTDRHTLLYYGRELYNAGRRESAIPLFIELLRDFRQDGDMRTIYETLAILARYYLYDEGGAIRAETLAEAEMYARAAVVASEINAEPLVWLGDCRLARNDGTGARQYYEQAMSRQYGTGGLQERDYYEMIPAMRLGGIARDEGRNEEALVLFSRAQECDPENKELHKIRKEIICDLLKTIL